MALQGKPVAIGTSATTIYTCPAGTEAAVHGLVFANNTGGSLTVDLAFYDQTTATTVTVATDLSVSANNYITWSKPINMNAGDYITATSSAASGLVALFSAYEGSATPVAIGFTGRGAWSSSSTYAVNDIVTVTGSGTYLALQASTNQNPTTATAYWMFLEGIAAPAGSSLPSQTGQAGKYLTTDGTNPSWAAVGGYGGATETVGASADIVLTSSSNKVQKFSFSGSYSVKLPDATTLSEGGEIFVLENNGALISSLLTTNGLPVTSLSPGSQITCYLVDNSTADGVWQINIGSAQGEFSITSTKTIDTGAIQNYYSCCQIADNKFLFAYMLETSNTALYLRVAQLSSGTWTLGTRTSITLTQGSSGTNNINPHTSICTLDTDVAVVCYVNYSSGNYYHYRSNVITVSGTTITVGSNTDISTASNTSYTSTSTKKLTTTSFIVQWSPYTSGTGWVWSLRAGSVSGTTITYGSQVTWTPDGTGPYAQSVSRFVLESPTLGHWFGVGNSSEAFSWGVRPVTISGTTITLGSIYTTPTVYLPTYYYGSVQMTQKDSSTMYVVAQYATSDLYATRWTKDTGYSPNRWTHATQKFIASNNSTSSSNIRMMVYSTGTVDRLCVINSVSGGLAGTGAGLTFFEYNNTTNSWNQTPYSFLIGNIAFNNHQSSLAQDTGLFKNSNGDLFFTYKNPSTNELGIMQIGLSQV
jgi:hypothetical protein